MSPPTSELYAIYLRKSRADLDAEARGEGETLSRHRQTLTTMAATRGLPVGEIYEEIVSGDTIEARPQMKRLLHDLEQRKWKGVIVMDVDRLGRGDSIDQGRILKTFKYSDAVIITLYKTFDPASEMDEEFFEYNQYMSRGEYKRIKRRLWAGREATAKEGKWQSPPPFGYTSTKLKGERGFTLEIVPEEADAVRMIFDLYLQGEGAVKIAGRLNAMGLRTHRGSSFTDTAVKRILENPTYTGKVRWNYKRTSVSMQGGVERKERRRSDECFVVQGAHQAIIDQETFDAAQLHRQSRAHRAKIGTELASPFASILKCGECGRAMVGYTDSHCKDFVYKCRTPGCKTSGASLAAVETVFMDGMRELLISIDRPAPEPSKEDQHIASQRKHLEKQLDTYRKQQSKLCDLLEQGVYTTALYLQRNEKLADQIRAAEAALAALTPQRSPSEEAAALKALRPQIITLLDVWPYATPAEKNALLKACVQKIVYHKTYRCLRREKATDYLTLDIFPLFLPPSQG